MSDLIIDHKYSPEYIESLIPWEYEIMLSLLLENMKRKADAVNN